MFLGIKVVTVAAFCGAIAGAIGAIVYNVAYADGMEAGAAQTADGITAAAADRSAAGE